MVVVELVDLVVTFCNICMIQVAAKRDLEVTQLNAPVKNDWWPPRLRKVTLHKIIETALKQWTAHEDVRSHTRTTYWKETTENIASQAKHQQNN